MARLKFSTMLVAELRYIGSWLAFFGAFGVSAALALTLGISAHLSPSISGGLFFVFLCTLGFIALTVWLRNVKADAPAPLPARYGPIVFPAAFLLLEAYWIVTRIPELQAAHWKQGVESFAILCMTAGVFAFYTLRDWQHRYRREAIPVPIPAFTQKRLEQFAAAYGQPTRAEQRRALRPLRIRGFLRLGLVVSEVILLLVLAPRMGIGPGGLLSFAIVAITFLIGHKFFDL